MSAVYMHVGVYVYDQFYRGKLSAFVAVTLLVGFNPPPSLPVIFGLEIVAPGITS